MRETRKIHRAITATNYFIIQENSTITETAIYKIFCQKFTRDVRISISIVYVFSQKYGKYVLLSSQSNCSYIYVPMINLYKHYLSSLFSHLFFSLKM